MRMEDEWIGKVMTVLGPVEPELLGAVLMHEHLHFDMCAREEKPISAERMELLMGYAVPNLKRLHDYNCHAYCDWEFIKAFVEAIRGLFQDGFADRLVLGLDWSFQVRYGNSAFIPTPFKPPPAYVYMFTHVLPRLKKLGLKEEEIQQMLVKNPARILPIR